MKKQGIMIIRTAKLKLRRYRLVKANHDRKCFNHKLILRHCKWRRNKSEIGVPQQVLKALHEELDLFSDFERIRAPRCLSLIENTEQVLRFINRLSTCYEKKKKVFVVLKNTKRITGDALVLLLSNVVEFKASGIEFNGNKPKEPKVAKQVESSGFFKILYDEGEEKINYKDQNSFTINDDKNIYTHATKNVDSELTASLIENAAEFLWGTKRRCIGVQRIMIELMQNTNNHASRKSGEKFWWLSITKEINPKRVCFSFIDYGMGVFRSLATKGTDDKFYGWIERMRSICSPDNHYEVLNKMMTGEFHKTVTGKSYRGKGIPGIYKEIGKRSITKLSVISNDAFGNAIDNDFHKLLNPLKGTFIYFELDESCNNLPVI